MFPPTAPPHGAGVRARRGQLAVEQLVDRYQIACRPVRDLLVDYLRERQAAHGLRQPARLAVTLGRLFWGTWNSTIPASTLCACRPAVAAGVETARPDQDWSPPNPRADVETPAARQRTERLTAVRAFYLDIAHWASEDPARWGPWAVPCPIRAEEISQPRNAASRKSRMDQRTRERLPILPVLIATVDSDAREPPNDCAAAQPSLPVRHSPPPARRCAASRHRPRHAGQDLGRRPADRRSGET